MAWWLVLVVIVTWVPAGWLAGRFGQALLGHGGLEWDWSRPLDTLEGQTWRRISWYFGWLSWAGVLLFLGLVGVCQYWLRYDPDTGTAAFNTQEIDDLKATNPY